MVEKSRTKHEIERIFLTVQATTGSKYFKWLQFCNKKNIRTLALKFTLFFTLKFIHLLSLQSFFFAILWCSNCHSKEYTNYLSIDFCIQLKIDCTRENGLNCWKIHYNETQCLCLVIICISYTCLSFDIFFINRMFEWKKKRIFFIFLIEFEQMS